MFAAPILAAIDQIARAAPKRIVWPAEWIDLAVAVIVEADIEPDFRHPLRVPHRAGPRADHLLGCAPALVDDAQRVDQLGFPIGAPARLAPGERRERRDHRAHMILLHERVTECGLDAPKSEDHAALDTEILFDARQQRPVFLQPVLPSLDAPVRNAAVDVLPEL